MNQDELISTTVDKLYTKLTANGAFKHKHPSETTEKRFDAVEKKIDVGMQDIHSHLDSIKREIKSNKDEIKSKAPKAWLHWLWGLMGLLATVMTMLMGALYGEMKSLNIRLNDNLTNILIEQARMQEQVQSTNKSITNLEKTLELAE